eukprot:jgi/Astpho2/9727/Aster-03708
MYSGTIPRAASTAVEQEAAQPQQPAPQRPDLPKNFDAASTEQRLYAWWEQQGFFAPSEDATGEPFTMSMPPPNVTGRLHMGHAMFVTLQDIMARTARMRGRPTLWLPGTDHAGIATQMVVEKMLAAEGKSRLGMGREAFTEQVWKWREQYGGFIQQQLRRLGASCDWSREGFTLDAQLSDAVLEAFVRLHDKGLIYKGSYMVNWSPNLQTAVSDLEVDYTEEAGSLFHFKYPLADSDDFLPVATTRPETIMGDSAVAVHPEDERYRHLVGRECQVPLSDRRIKIIADEYVDREFGTGALKITPGHDPNDYEIGQRCSLDIINIMNNDGSLNAAAGQYAGLDRFEARKRLWQDLEAAGLAIKKEPYTMRVPRSQRGGEVVEPLVRKQWFVRMKPLAEPALQAVADGRLNIVPDRFSKVYDRWLTNIRDWCISRQLWWGHRIPVWYAFSTEEEADAADRGVSEIYVVARSQKEALSKAQQRHGSGVVLRQEQDVLDTWFSSGLWPFSTLGWPNKSAPDLQRFYPTTILETGHDILFFWVARMVMMGIELTGQVPFKTVFLHGLVRDAQGRKMSKSLGNVVDPVETIQEYGSDALRFTLATGKNLTNKLWNAGKFIMFNLKDVTEQEWDQLGQADFTSQKALESLPLAERWIVSMLHEVVTRSTTAHDRQDFGDAGREFYDFFWGEFADWYIEAAKARLYSSNVQAAAQTRQVLVYVYDALLKLAHPFMPYVTEELWQAMPHQGSALIVAPWPATSAPVDPQALEYFGSLQATVRSIRNARAEYGVELARKVPATLQVASPELREELAAEADVLCLLAKVDRQQFSMEGAVAGARLFDAAKELQRLQKQRDRISKELQGLQGRLQNEKFLQNAKPDKSSTKPRPDDSSAVASLSETLRSSARTVGPKVKPDQARGLESQRSGFMRAMSDAGLKPTIVYHNLTPAELYEKALMYEAGTHITDQGALATLSGAKTGRSPRDKRVVREADSEKDIWWNQEGNGSPNYECDERTFLLNRERAVDYLNMLERLYVFDGFAGWDPESRIKIRVVCARAYHALFMYNMLIRPTDEELLSFGRPDFTIFNAGAFPVNRYTSYMSSSTSVDLHMQAREMVILGTQYAGEMKKGIFTVMHYLMPKRGILSLHSGCNVGKNDDVTLFFGLSGTGKTTLSTDPARPLIGDDEHCWGNNGVFNIEGGCYAKCIGLKKQNEPEIYKAIKFGTVLENVVFDENTRLPDFDNNAVTENTRASYPIEYIDNARIPCMGPHPKNLILLCCDAFGVLPPVSRLTREQAMYHFISGYTAKVAGTEMGVTEPEATFSACFGGAFLMWHPMKYASMLADKMNQHGTTAWLVNTGWTGGRWATHWHKDHPLGQGVGLVEG